MKAHPNKSILVAPLSLVAACLLTSCDDPSSSPTTKQASQPSQMETVEVAPEGRATEVAPPPAEAATPAPFENSGGAPPPQITKTTAFNLVDQNGSAFSSNQLSNRVWVATFFSTRGQSSSPAQTAEILDLQQFLRGLPMWNDVQLLSITIDPDHDTAQELNSYAANTSAQLDNWALLTGDKTAIWELSKTGFKLDVAENPFNQSDPYIHSPQLALVDRLGFVRGYYDCSKAAEKDKLRRDIRIVIAQDATRVAMPLEIINPGWEEQRHADQLSTRDQFNVFVDFEFEDQLSESGITWRHQVVDDAGKSYKPCHYDHGNGVPIADVDGDGLLDIYFITQIGENQLWKNKGDGTFENITEGSGLKVRDKISVTASFADIDNDGDPDLYLTTVLEGNHLFLNDGNGRFSDISESSGTDYKGHSSGVTFFDYNKDGLLDLFVSNVGDFTTGEIREQVTQHPHNPLQDGEYKFHDAFKDAFSGHLKADRHERSLLYRNEGEGKFTDVTTETKLEDLSWTGDALALDLNEDGWTDLYLTVMQGDDQYWENVDGKSFINKSRELFPKTPWGTMGIGVTDYDNDEDLDIVLTDMHSDMSEDSFIHQEKLKRPTKYADSLLEGSNPIFGNAFYRNKGDGSFEEVSDTLNSENYWPWGLSVGDLNADGYDDILYISSMNFPYRYAPNTLLINNNGKKFLDSEYILGIEPRKDRITASWWFDLDIQNQADPSSQSENPTNSAEVWGARGGRSSVIFDIDQDGDLDIVISEFNNEPRMLISNLSDQKASLAWIKIHLIGTKSNRNGLGAIVKIKTTANTFTKLNNGKSGYLSQSVYPLYFGLGENTDVKEIEITWPSGIHQVINEDIQTNRTLTIREQE